MVAKELVSRFKKQLFLIHKSQLIGELIWEKDVWRFKYDSSYTGHTLANFPDKQKIYSSEELFPFFKAGIPAGQDELVFLFSEPRTYIAHPYKTVPYHVTSSSD